MWRLIYHAPLLVLFLLINVFFILLGWIMVPIAAACGAYRAAPGFDGEGTPREIFHFTWAIMAPWQNREDGVANDTYVKFENMFLRICYWSIIRNPAQGLRWMPYLSCKIDPKRVRWIGGPWDNAQMYDRKPAAPEWFYAWHGIYSNIWWQFKFNKVIYRLWAGHKIFPSDIYGVTPYRKDGAGFAIQFKAVNKTPQG